MNKKLISILSGLIATVLGCNAEITNYELKVNDFSELKVVDNVDVIYRCNPDSAGMAVFKAEASHASGIIFQPNGTKLQVELAPDAPKSGLPVVTVYSTYLTKVENAGIGTVRVYDPARGPKLKVRLIGNGRLMVEGIDVHLLEGSIDTGNGTVVVKGKCDSAKLTNTGSGQIEADQLIAKQVKCSIWGTGSIGCSAEEALSVSCAGSGQVYYLGNPSVKNRSIGVKALPLNSK